MLNHLHFIQVLSILATFTLALERPCSKYSPIFTLSFIYTDYLFVFPRTHFGIFCVFVLIRLFNSFRGNSSSFFGLSVMSCLLGRLPCHAPLCHLQSVIRCAFGFHYELALTMSLIHRRLCFLAQAHYFWPSLILVFGGILTNGELVKLGEKIIQ